MVQELNETFRKFNLYNKLVKVFPEIADTVQCPRFLHNYE